MIEINSSSAESEARYVVNVQLVIRRGNKLLMIRRGLNESHAAGVIDLPGGKLESSDGGDNALEFCARRELSEETSVVYNDELKYVTSAIFVADDGVAVVNLVFKGAISENTDIPIGAGRDEQECFWLEVAKIPSHAEIPSWTKEYIRKALD